MVVVIILGLLAAASVPLYHQYVLEAAHAEAATNLAEIATKEEVYFAAYKQYVPVDAGFDTLSSFGARAPQLDPSNAWAVLGFAPDPQGGIFSGPVYYRYAVHTNDDNSSYIVCAQRRIDQDTLEHASLQQTNPTAIVYNHDTTSLCQ